MSLSKDGATLTIDGKEWSRKGASGENEDNPTLSEGTKKAIRSLQDLRKDTKADIETANKQFNDAQKKRDESREAFEQTSKDLQESMSEKQGEINTETTKRDEQEDNRVSAKANQGAAQDTIETNRRDEEWWKANKGKRLKNQKSEIAGYEEVIGMVE